MFSCFLQARKMDVWTWTSKTVYSSVCMMGMIGDTENKTKSLNNN